MKRREFISLLGGAEGARDSAAVIVEPVSHDVPVGKLGHENLHERQYDVNRGLCHRQRNCGVIHNGMNLRRVILT